MPPNTETAVRTQQLKPTLTCTDECTDSQRNLQVVVAGDELPNLEPALANIDPIPARKTLMVVNNFIISTTGKYSALTHSRKLAATPSTSAYELSRPS